MEIINEQNFQSKVASGVVLVDFFATWCGPCKMLAPVLEKLSEKYAGKAEIYKVDVDQSNALAAQFGVQAIPTMIVFKDGQAVKTHTGFAGAPQIEAMLDSYL